MLKLLTHQWLITSGCLLWCVSYFGEEGGLQPFSTLGLATAPILLIVGIVYWAQHYHRTRGYYPNVRRIVSGLIGGMTGSPFFGIIFLFRHLLQFWTLSILFWMAISLLGFGLFTYSDAFEATQQYCKANSDTLLKTGEIKYYSPLVSGNIKMHDADGSAELYFTIIGAKGNFDAESRLIKQDGTWMVQELKMTQ